MNRKSRTAACRSPEQTRPRLLKEYRAPAAAACSHAAAGSTHHARMRSDQEPPPPGGPRFAQPGRPTREWSGRLAQTRGQDRQDYVQHGPGRPFVGETPANTVDVFLASAAPPARDSGCPPNRVNPKTYQVKYQRAADCLTKDRDALLAFYDFPAEHSKHLRTTTPIESTFATVRHRTIRSKGCLSRKTALAMVFKLVEGAQKSWRRIDGHNQLPKLIQGIRFTDGIEVIGNSVAPQSPSRRLTFRPSPKFGDSSAARTRTASMSQPR